MITRFAQPTFALSLVTVILLLASSPLVTSYHLSPDDGQADIGAYHVQAGRCADVERRLGRRYTYFWRSSPFYTTFTPDPSSSLVPTAGSGVEQMDATSLCTSDPLLNEGYGAGFDKMRLYLVYSRCLFGTNEMRVLCGTIDDKGKPMNSYFNLVQANCPQGARCKNLCATMRDPKLTSPYAAKQVQLAQCMDEKQWEKLTEMYKPKPATPGVLAAPRPSHLDPQIVDKVPTKDPTQDQTKPDQDGIIAGQVLSPTSAGQSKPGHTTGHLQLDPKQPPTPPTQHEQPKADQDANGAKDNKDPPQKALTAMGFRRRSLDSSASGRRHQPHGHRSSQVPVDAVTP
ncbi:hypothetical protein PHBOTO_000298 [Pseudozyma hubeiensis]|nr:hypothetical protein PHBOTO_000298 [Pseudozyma hubeiensis]